MISEFPLFIFTTFAGLAAGVYIANAMFPLEQGRKAPWAFPLMCLVLLGLGLLGCLAHLVRPELFLNALANPRAGITQEAYLSIVFGLMLVIDLVVTWRKGDAPRALRIVGSVVAFALTAVMGLAYVSSLGTPAWTSWATVPLFVAGDLFMGFALFALFAKKVYGRPAFFGTVVALAALLLISLVVEAMHFAGVGFSALPFVVAIIFAPVASVGTAAFARKNGKSALVVATFACAFVGVCIARWVFYAASVI